MVHVKTVIQTLKKGIQNKLQGNTTATEPARPKFSAAANPTKDPEVGENLPLGGQGELEATKNTPSSSESGDYERNYHLIKQGGAKLHSLNSLFSCNL